MPKPAQAYEPEVPVKMREWIGPALATPGFVLGLQPPAQPNCCVAVECPIRLADGAYMQTRSTQGSLLGSVLSTICGSEGKLTSDISKPRGVVHVDGTAIGRRAAFASGGSAS